MGKLLLVEEPGKTQPAPGIRRTAALPVAASSRPAGLGSKEERVKGAERLNSAKLSGVRAETLNMKLLYRRGLDVTEALRRVRTSLAREAK